MKNLSHYLKNSSVGLAQLALKSGLSESRLRAIREGNVLPSYSELRSISDTLNLPTSFLLSEYIEDPNYKVLFRKQLGSTTDEKVVNNFNFYIDNIIALKPDLSKVEDIRSKIQPLPNTYPNAEALAFFFRQEYFDNNHFDPLISLPSLLSNKLGFIVKVIELGKNADGASAIINNLVFLILSPRFIGRMLFTLAHELGHILNHHEPGDFIYVDKKINLNPKDDKQKIEGFANAFASCLLLPEKGVAILLNKVREINQISSNSPLSDIEILYLSRFYGVSFDVAGFRCEALGLLPKGGSYSLSQQIRLDFDSAEKRADQLGIPSREEVNFPQAPDFILDKAIDLIEKEEYSIGKIANLLSISVNTLLEHHTKIG
ncbi:MAG TPA: XRE family transcriptional regulator [Saprospiraceae bacterium]|nr:XRE family transcriptional regulator [Saprospiraceae bacterium]